MLKCNNCWNKTTKKEGLRNGWFCKYYDLYLVDFNPDVYCGNYEEIPPKNCNNEIDYSPIGADGFSVQERGL